MPSAILRKTAILGASAAMAGTAGLAAFAPSASASARDGWCESGEFCYYYNSAELDYGSGSDFRGSLSNYGSSQPSCYDFRMRGESGYGKCIKNNAAAYWNKSNRTVRVYYNSGYKGRYFDIRPGTWGNLPAWLKNNNASHKFL